MHLSTKGATLYTGTMIDIKITYLTCNNGILCRYNVYIQFNYLLTINLLTIIFIILYAENNVYFLFILIP